MLTLEEADKKATALYQSASDSPLDEWKKRLSHKADGVYEALKGIRDNDTVSQADLVSREFPSAFISGYNSVLEELGRG